MNLDHDGNKKFTKNANTDISQHEIMHSSGKPSIECQPTSNMTANTNLTKIKDGLYQKESMHILSKPTMKCFLASKMDANKCLQKET